MNTPFIIPLKEAFDLNLVGGKAVNLAKMIQAQLPVPDGFVVTTSAYKSASDGKVSEKLAAQIKKAFVDLDCSLVAARSSATAEDMEGASMAGQYETYLNLKAAEDVIDGVEKCWKSIRSDRTAAYLNQHNIDPNEVAMAVVVQKLVQADIAGVLFTVDPKTGSRDKMIIESVWGLGEGLVSGEVQPDVITVNNNIDSVESYTVADKKKALYPGEKGFQSVKEEVRKKACLQFKEILKLKQLGQVAVKHFEQEQDIEWAVEKGVVYILQARPVTTLSEIDAYNSLVHKTKIELTDLIEKGHGPWVRHNIGETLPHPTPFTWEVISRFMSGDGGFGQMYRELGFTPGPAVLNGTGFLKKIAGEVYMDCSLMTEMFAEKYPFKYDVEKLRSNPDAAQNPPTIPTGSVKELNAAAKQSVEVAAKLGKLAASLEREFDEIFVPELTAWLDDQDKIKIEKLSDDDLIKTWEEQEHKVMTEFGKKVFLPSMVEALAVENLRSFLEEHCWYEDPKTLMSTLSVSTKVDQTILSNIELGKVHSEEMPLQDWIKKHGHRAPGEFELATPRWSERPEDVLKLAENISVEADLAEIHTNRVESANESMERMRKYLSLKKYKDFEDRVKLVQRYSRFREDGKYYLIKAYSVLRKTALEFGRRLELNEEVFYLKPHEVLDAVKTGFIPGDKVIIRKLEYEAEKRFRLPHVISSEDIESIGVIKKRPVSASIQAFSVSNGTCSGPVKIVKSPEEIAEFPHGAILVCPSTDPSWTPLFVKAAGLILERGGSLSHGAVVAREMGLPAVVIDGATEIFNDDELISVDADSGWIYRDGAEESLTDESEKSVQWALVPPPVSRKEKRVNQLGLIAAVFWALFLGAVYLLPPEVLLNPIMSNIDFSVWPLIRSFGMVGAVAVVAVLFALVPIVMQKYMTDNERLYEGKKRANNLLREAKKLTVDSPRRKHYEELAAPITKRILKASMVPLAFILGPMMMIFMWFPERVDPLSWSADPGRMVSIVAEVDGDETENIILEVPVGLSVNGTQSEVKKLPPVRTELEELRNEWKKASDMKDLPWEVQSAGDHARQLMLASLNSYLREGVPHQKVSWLVNVPDNAFGSHDVKLTIGKNIAAKFELVFGTSEPPQRGMIKMKNPSLKSVTVNYPRALHKAVFWSPFSSIGGPQWDFGWLGVYLLVYLPLMFVAKFVLRVP